MITPYFEYDFPENIKTWIVENWLPDAGLSCADESHKWAKRLLEHFPEIDLEVHEGFAVTDGDPQDSEGHTWLFIEGYVFDPTRDQFQCDFMEYDTHQYWESEDLIKYLANYGYKVNIPQAVELDAFSI